MLRRVPNTDLALPRSHDKPTTTCGRTPRRRPRGRRSRKASRLAMRPARALSNLAQSELDWVHVADKTQLGYKSQTERGSSCPTMTELIRFAERIRDNVKRGQTQLDEAIELTEAMFAKSHFREMREKKIKAIVSALIMRPPGATVCGSTSYPRLFDHLAVSPFHANNVPGKDEFGRLIGAFMRQHFD
eukprot:2868859-Prymnesium_polylepis.1